MKHLTITLFAILGLSLTGCGGSSPAPAPDPADEPAADSDGEAAAAQTDAPTSDEDPVAKLAAALRANPEDAPRLLAEAGMTLEQFEAAMFEMAKDPSRSGTQ